jgi:S-adenosylmethionine synthetase
MEYTKLGNAELTVSRICMGCMGFGDPGRGQHSWTIDEVQSREIIRRGLELGVNFFDTAIAYQSGTSEQYLGRALRDFAQRDKVVVATKFLCLLKAYPCRMLKADAKAQVSFDYDTGKITTFLCSVQHVHGVEVEDFRDIIEKLMVRTATAYGLNTDFVKLVNPTGRFVIGSSFADCGVTGRKLACDTYGGIGHIGGGALSGKDPSKVDRSGAYAARWIARNLVAAKLCSQCEVSIVYAIGVCHPVGITVNTFGTGMKPDDELAKLVWRVFDLKPSAIIKRLKLNTPSYSLISVYGHFGRTDLNLPWEQGDMADKLRELAQYDY